MQSPIYTLEPAARSWFPLVKRFYQEHYPSGKPNKSDPTWVLHQQFKLAAAVRLRQFPDCQLFTGMLVRPDLRGKGVGQELIQRLRSPMMERSTFCFAFQHLEHYYRSHGFQMIESSLLPFVLQSRLNAYLAGGKKLIAMNYHPEKAGQSS